MKFSVTTEGVAQTTDVSTKVATTAKKKAPKLVKTTSAHGGPGTITVKVKLTKQGSAKLRQKGKLKVRVVYTPDQGISATKKLKLRSGEQRARPHGRLHLRFPPMDELALAKRLIAFDTSNAEGLRRAAEFVGGWLESNDIAANQTEARGLPVTTAEVGGADGAPTLVLHGHMDVVPGGREQFEPRIEGDRLLGRGRLRHEGRARRDADRARTTSVIRRTCGCASASSPTRNPRRRRTADPTHWCRAASSATSRSRASRPTFRSGYRRRASSRCGSGSRGARPTGPPMARR